MAEGEERGCSSRPSWRGLSCRKQTLYPYHTVTPAPIAAAPHPNDQSADQQRAAPGRRTAPTGRCPRRRPRPAPQRRRRRRPGHGGARPSPPVGKNAPVGLEDVGTLAPAAEQGDRGVDEIIERQNQAGRPNWTANSCPGRPPRWQASPAGIRAGHCRHRRENHAGCQFQRRKPAAAATTTRAGTNKPAIAAPPRGSDASQATGDNHSLNTADAVDAVHEIEEVDEPQPNHRGHDPIDRRGQKFAEQAVAGHSPKPMGRPPIGPASAGARQGRKDRRESSPPPNRRRRQGQSRPTAPAPGDGGAPAGDDRRHHRKPPPRGVGRSWLLR